MRASLAAVLPPTLRPVREPPGLAVAGCADLPDVAGVAAPVLVVTPCPAAGSPAAAAAMMRMAL